MFDRKAVRILLVVVIVAALLALSVILIGYSSSQFQQVTAPSPTPTSKPTPIPLFTVTLSPNSQTVVQELDQTLNFNIQTNGNIQYPCAISFHSSDISDTKLYQLGLSNAITSQQNYAFSGGFVYSEGNSGHFSFYVTVIDSQGHSYNSNSVTVVLK